MSKIQAIRILTDEEILAAYRTKLREFEHTYSMPKRMII
jgi:hypothetical protein